MDNSLITVVIPVYNVKPYLNRCLDSILSQTYKNIEIILIDDGSNDGSEKICEEYARNIKNIRVIHKRNGGLSEARNRGVLEAKGKYITFIDSDDFITSDYIEYLYKLIIDYNADLSICNYLSTTKDKIHKNFNKDIIVYENNLQAINAMLYQKDFSPAAWGKLYKLNSFNGVCFPVGKIYEDIGTLYKILSTTNKVVYGKSIKYGYFYRESGIVREAFTLRKMNYTENMSELVREIEIHYSAIRGAAISRYLWACVHVLMQFDVYEIEKYKKEYSFLKDELNKYYKDVLKDKEVKLRNKVVLYLAVKDDRKLYKLYCVIKKG